MARRPQKGIPRGGKIERSPRPQHAAAYRYLASQVKVWRLQAAVPQVEMARRMRLSQSQVAKIESGDRRLDPVEFAAWCRACGMTPSDGMEKLGL